MASLIRRNMFCALLEPDVLQYNETVRSDMFCIKGLSDRYDKGLLG